MTTNAFPEPSPDRWESASGIPVALIPVIDVMEMSGPALDAANVCHYGVFEIGCESTTNPFDENGFHGDSEDVLGYVGLATANAWCFQPLTNSLPISVDPSDMTSAVEALIFHILIGKDDGEDDGEPSTA